MKSNVGAQRSTFSFQYVTTPTSDTPGTTILLHFNNRRYFFGHISEGTQRACIQRGVTIKKVKDVFLTGPTRWANNGGLIGLILSKADVHAGDIGQNTAEPTRFVLHGGPKLTHTLACARRFVFRQGMPLAIHEYPNEKRRDGKAFESPDMQDENIEVWTMAVAYDQGEPGPRGEPLSDHEGASSPETSSRPGSRKRSHEEFREEKYHLEPEDQSIRSQVVKEMFESTWRFDHLIETTISEVKMPAAMFVRDIEAGKLMPYKLPPVDAPQPSADFKVLTRTPWPAALRDRIPRAKMKTPPPSMSYIVKGHNQRGKFDTKKARDLEIPPGPLYARLTAGESITLDNGRTISPDMVLGETRIGRGIAILDLPTVHYVQALIDRPEWQSEHIMRGVEAMCWTLGAGVLIDARLQKFMKENANVQHIISSPDACPNYLSLDSAASSAIRLNRVSNLNFPVPVHNNIMRSDEALSTTAENLASNLNVAHRDLKFKVDPQFEMVDVATDQNKFLDTAKVIRDLPEEVIQLAKSLKSTDANTHEVGTREDPEIITLGTGSALPSKYRNVSATLIRIPGHGNYLLDCGENTLGQLARVFDKQELEDVLRNLKFIWISHLHADHHLGTMSVLLAKQALYGREELELPQNQLYICSEIAMMDFLHDYGSVEPVKNVQRLVAMNEGIFKKSQPFDIAAADIHVKTISTCRVSHCHGARAICIKFENGLKISYSGDCRPSENFAKMGYGSDLLIHEATFDDGMEVDARAKKHSTTGEALGVAVAMGAKNVLLTHFSQRYQKIPNMGNVRMPEHQNGDTENEAPEDDAELDPINHSVEMVAPISTAPEPMDGIAQTSVVTTASLKSSVLNKIPVAIGFDYMKVKLSEIGALQRMTPALVKLFEALHPEDNLEDLDESEKSEALNRSKVKTGKGADGKGKESAKAAKKKARQQEIDAQIQQRRDRETKLQEAFKAAAMGDVENTGEVDEVQEQMAAGG